ncbi:GNAT family N-acetyltransferase [Actinokineospora sp. 24-640]
MSGAHRVTVESGAALPAGDWAYESGDLREAWPYLGPTWLSATETSLHGARPWHTVAHRARGEVAYLPGFVFDAPPSVDFDPRTYLGWQGSSGEEVCCGVTSCSDTVSEVDSLGVDAFFPALVLGSPLGYRSEVAFTFWTKSLFPALLDHAVKSAAAQGFKSVVAPWIPDRAGNEQLVDAFSAVGGSTAFWGYEDYLRLDAADYAAHIAALPAKRRRRVKEDVDRVAAAGVVIERVTGADLRGHVGRVAKLTCLNREKNGAGEEPSHIEAHLHALLDAGVDVRCHLAMKDGVAVGSCVTIRKTDRLFIKWAGFDYSSLGERSGVYFGLVLDAPVREAYAEGLRYLECGAGAHEAKALRGCLPRGVTTGLVMTDPALRSRTAAWLADFGKRRREVFGAEPVSAAGVNLLDTSDDSCCGNG